MPETLRNGLAASVALTLLGASTAFGQADWEIEGDHGPSTTIEFQTDEATWMNVDVRPDGRTVAFDILGDIYRVPIEGGTAELLTGGVSYEHQPRYSPDGSTIAFVSDRGGADNIWLMDADGSNRRQLTEEQSTLPTAPYWTPDGEYVVVKRHVTDTRSLGGGALWMYHRRGGSGIEIVEKLSFTSDMNEPTVSPDGRYIYYSFTGPFDYNRDPHDGIFQVNRYDRQTGETEPVTRDAGGAARPTPSPDGRWLAFIRRVRTNTVLFVRDLETGAERALFDGLDKDQMETWTVHGAYPAFDWTPDSERIVITYGGKLWSIDVQSGASTAIPFQAQVSQRVTEALHFEYPIADDSLTAQMIRWPVLTPDGERLVFQAVGRIWQMRLPDGRPERVVEGTALQYAPGISPDGEWVTYVTWSAEAGGHVWRARLPAPGRQSRGERLTRTSDQYANPSFAPDGDRIAFVRGSGRVNRGEDLGGELFLEIRWIPAEGGASHLVTTTANRGPNRRMPRIRWSPDGTRVLFQESEEGKTLLTSVRLDGTDERHLVENERAEEIVPSPDGRHVAFKELHRAYVAPLPRVGETLTLEASNAGVPVEQLTRYGGNWLDWSADGRHVSYVLGPRVYRHSLDQVFTDDDDEADAEDAPDESPAEQGAEGEVESPPNHIPEGDVYEIQLTVPKSRPGGRIALTGARVITMSGDRVIENGTIVVNGNRITAVGPAADVTIPENVEVVDVSGKTIIPGLVDVHAHMGYSALDINPENFWPYLANLAFGVTTTQDPSASTQAVFAQKELVEAGAMLGPRIYSTGFVLYGAENPNKAVIESLDDARAHIHRLKAQGATNVKSYNQLRRDARQWVVKAAREEEILVYPEGASMYQQNITHILDGHTGIEHAIPIVPLYEDAVQLLARSGTGYTPTLVVGYGGLWGENYWYQHFNVWENERLLQFVPREIVDARSRRRVMAPEEEFHHFDLARTAKEIVDAGGRVQLGAHGQLQGLGAHWELWMFEQGGMTPLEALRAATLWGADYVGLSDDLGSLEAGKLADLVVLDANPLTDIRNTERISMVMKNGFLYNEDLDQLWPEQKPRPELRWRR